MSRAPETRQIPAGDPSRPGEPTVPTRSARLPRSAQRYGSLREISSRLQPRDYVLAHLLTEHRYLTTNQIAQVLFGAEGTCRNRLDALRRIGWLDWFAPIGHRQRRTPLHWIPGPLAARYVALAHGERPPTARAVRDLQDSLVASQLRHNDGTNQLFIDLLTHARAHRETRLTRWWPARRVAATINHALRPDGHGVWRDHDQQVAFFLEYDTGTESHTVLQNKLAAYRTLAGNGGPDWPVLLVLPSDRREINLHRHLDAAASTVLVATTTHERAVRTGPAGPIWRLGGDGRDHRLRLAELPSDLGAVGPYHPGPPTPEQDPLYLLDTD